MNKKFRLLTLVLAAALLLSCCPNVFAYGISSSWAVPELDRMEELGLIPESLENQESLVVPTTRLQMCEMAVLAYETYTGEEIPVTNETPFTDTDDLNVAKAYALGLTNGYPDGTFDPEGLLARDQFCTITYRFLLSLGVCPQGDEGDVEYFLDGGSVASWAQDAVYAMVRFHVLQGASGKLMLKDAVTAEQSLVLFCRSYELLLTGGFENRDRFAGAKNWAIPELTEMDNENLIPNIVLFDDMCAPVTRREMCYVAVRAFYAMQYETFSETRPSPFTDVSDPVVTAAYYLGLMNGYGDGTFGPDDYLTREQLYTITLNFLTANFYYRNDAPNADMSRFSDWNQVSAYAQPATRLLVDMGIVKGTSDKKLLPKDYSDRESALLLFYRSYLALNDWMNEILPDPDRPLADELVDYAMQFVGYPYVWGGASPDVGFDCSGLVCYVFSHFGITLPHGATSQWNSSKGYEITYQELLPGDLIFFSNDGGKSMFHVAIYIGNNEYIHAANSSRGVVVDSINMAPSSWFYKNFYGCKRFIE